eukprot:401027_1
MKSFQDELTLLKNEKEKRERVPDGSTLLNRTDLTQQLKVFLPEERRNMSLIFKASRDGFGSNDFHQLCDNKGATLVVVKATHSDIIFGGYSCIAWKSSGGWNND